MDITKLSFDEFDQLTQDFTDKQIGDKFNISKNKVGYYRRRIGVKSYGEKNNLVVGVKGVSNPSNRKYSFNESFFQEIDCEIKAYTLGLLLADGHITKELHRVRIALTEADSYLLTQVADAIGFKGKFIVTKPADDNYQKYNMISFNLNSVNLVKDLLSLGFTPSKDTNLFLPKINPSLENHLIRGIIDGDGAILKNGEIVCLSGRKELLDDIVKCFARHGFDKVGGIYPDKSIHRLRMPQYAIPALDWVYECNPSIVLQRKLDLYRLRKQFIKSWDVKY